MKPLEALRALGTGGDAPSDAKQRVYAALTTSLAASAAAAAGAARAVAPTDGALGASGAAVVPSPAPFIGGLSGAKALVAATGIWLIGGATGAALYGALHPREVQLVYVDRPVLALSSASSSPSEVAPSASVSSAPLSPVLDASSAKRVATAAAGPTSELSRERALLDLARASAAHGEPALSLQQAERHRSQFPRGKLAEEREALAIRALLALGRSSEARARAQEFHSAHPNSFLLPAIDSALSAP